MQIYFMRLHHVNFKTLISEQLDDINYSMTQPYSGALWFDFQEYMLHQTQANTAKVVDDLIALREMTDKVYQICKNELNQNNVDI